MYYSFKFVPSEAKGKFWYKFVNIKTFFITIIKKKTVYNKNHKLVLNEQCPMLTREFEPMFS